MEAQVPRGQEPDHGSGNVAEAIRAASFASALLGYDRQEVDAFLAGIVGRLEPPRPVDAEVVRRELERVGEQTGGILREAEETAEELRADGERDARQRLLEAGQRAEEIVAEAEDRAESIVEDALQQRQVLEARIRRLQERHEALLAEDAGAGTEPAPSSAPTE